jgi:hypothetical protein
MFKARKHKFADAFASSIYGEAAVSAEALD